MYDKEREEARKVFPFLIGWVKKTERVTPIEYGVLGKATGVHRIFRLPKTLGYIAYWWILPDRKRPFINSLVVNKDTGIPGDAFEADPDTLAKLEKRDVNGKKRLFRELQKEVYDYPHWDEIIKDLGLTETLYYCEKLVEGMVQTDKED